METNPIPEAAINPLKKRNKAATPKRRGAVEPEIAAIHAEMRAKVAAHRQVKASAVLLQKIINKKLPQLTLEDRDKLVDALRGKSNV